MPTSRRGAATILACTLAIAACWGTDPLPGPGDAVLVSIFNGAFSPETVTTTVGKSVRWTNNDVVVHTVVSDSAQFTSMDLAPTWWVEKRFDSAGVFNVRCTVHGTEKGAIIVQ